MKAWCAWANSTPLLLLVLGIRQKTLDYPTFSLQNLRQLPFPNPDRISIDALVDAFNTQDPSEELQLIKDIDNDSARNKLDEAVAQAIGYSIGEIKQIRELMAKEPSLYTAKDFHN